MALVTEQVRCPDWCDDACPEPDHEDRGAFRCPLRRTTVLRFGATSPHLPNAVWSLHLQPHWATHTRLLARARVGLRHPGEVVAVELARPAIALTRWIWLGIKRRVERQINDLATLEFCC